MEDLCTKSIRRILTIMIAAAFVFNSTGQGILPSVTVANKDALRPMAAAKDRRLGAENVPSSTSSAGTLPDSIKHLGETGHTPASLDISIYKKSPYYTLPDDWELEVYPDIDDTGTVFAVKMIRAIQYWQYDMEFLKKHQKIIMQTCTGDTPWLGYKKFIDLYATWETRDTQAILRRLGINPDLKPDMSMIDIVALDAIFPQKRDAYHAFANILTGFYDPLGIPDENRHFFYGDLIMDEETGVLRRMTGDEYSSLVAEIDDKGFRLDEFLIGNQRRRPSDMLIFTRKYPMQSLHFNALLYHAKKMSTFLQGNGGAHIYLYGLGPSDFAEGHIGFNEAHTPINSNAFIASIVYHIAAAHAKELGRGGMGDLVDKVRMSEQRFNEFVYKFGRITFSYNDFVKRDDAVNIIISTGNSKSSSNARAVEGPSEPDERFPISVVIRSTRPSSDTRRPKNSLVIDDHSALDLRITRSPYEFSEFSDWSEYMIIEFFVKLSKLVKKPIARLQEEDFLNLGLDELGESAQDIDWQGIKMRNLKALLAGPDKWEALKQHVIQVLASRIHTAKGAADSLISGLTSAEILKMLWVNPHADDEYLGTMGSLIKELIDAGVEMVTYYTSEGYTSVDDGYVINILRYILQNYDDAAIAKILDDIQAGGIIQKQLYENVEKDLCKELIQYLRRSNQHVGSYDWQPWSRMKDKERDLRSKLVLLRLLRLYGGAIGTNRDLKAALTHIIDTTLNKEEWGNADLDEIKDIKLGIRTIEAKTALMHLGARYENVHEPLQSTWYGLEGRETGRSSDKDRIKRVFLEEKPTLLGGNGERFGDMASHSLTENLLAAGLIELEAEGLIDLRKMRMLLYAGVWHRISQDEEGCRLSMVLSEQEMETGAGTFEGFYPSQQLPGVPYSGFREPMGFGRMVIGNAIRGRDELHTLGIVPANIAAATKLAQEGSGVLNYKVLEFNDEKSRDLLRSKMRMWEKVSPAVNASSNKVFHGPLSDRKPVRPLNIPGNPRLILTPEVLGKRALNMIDQAA